MINGEPVHALYFWAAVFVVFTFAAAAWSLFEHAERIQFFAWFRWKRDSVRKWWRLHRWQR